MSKNAGAALVQAAKEFTEAHYYDKFSLEKMALALFVNGNHLARVFKSRTGYTLPWYHSYVRCETAKRLLADSSLSIAWIAQQVGDISPSHFSRIFRKYVGALHRNTEKINIGTHKAEKHAIIFLIGNALAWIFVPCGFDKWKAVIASILGIAAKEEVVGTLGAAKEQQGEKTVPSTWMEKHTAIG